MNSLKAKMSSVPKHTFDSDELWMQRALSRAQRALEPGVVPVGAAVVHEGRIALAANSTETSTSQALIRPLTQK